MSILRGLRYPAALAFGLLLMASIFWSLWSFTKVTFELDVVRTVAVDFSRTIIDSPPERKFQVEEIKRPPVIEIDGPEILVDDFGPALPPVVFDAQVEPAVKPGMFPVAQDRDVMPLVRVSPVYPPRAAARGIEGWVQVQFTIMGTGSVTDVIVVDSSPPNVFDDAAVEAVSRWRYNPKVEGAVAVDRVGVQTLLRFTLEEE